MSETVHREEDIPYTDGPALATCPSLLGGIFRLEPGLERCLLFPVNRHHRARAPGPKRAPEPDFADMFNLGQRADVCWLACLVQACHLQSAIQRHLTQFQVSRLCFR